MVVAWITTTSWLFLLLQMLLVAHKFYRQVKYYAYAPLHLITFRFASQYPPGREWDCVCVGVRVGVAKSTIYGKLRTELN